MPSVSGIGETTGLTVGSSYTGTTNGASAAVTGSAGVGNANDSTINNTANVNSALSALPTFASTGNDNISNLLKVPNNWSYTGSNGPQ